MQNLTFIILIVSEKIATLKLLSRMDNRLAGLTLIIAWTHIFHVSKTKQNNNNNKNKVAM